MYFSPKKNVDYEIFQFRQAIQQPSETVDQFATRLRKMASNCEFHDTDKEIKAVSIQNCQSKRLRRSALRDQARVVSVDLHGLIRQAHVLPKEKPAKNVGSQTILQKCVAPSPVPDHVSTGAAKMWMSISQ